MFEKLPVTQVAIEEDKPDLLIPDPVATVLPPMYHAGAGPLSFSFDVSPSPPTTPISAKLTFLAAQQRTT